MHLRIGFVLGITPLSKLLSNMHGVCIEIVVEINVIITTCHNNILIGQA